MKDKPPIEAHRGESSVAWHYCTGQVEQLVLPKADPDFTWIRGIFGMPYGMCYLDKRERVEDGVRHVYEYMTDIRLTVTRTLTDEGYVERYEWQNVGKKAVEIAAREVGVYVTFAERYDIREVAVPYRAYTHFLLAEDVFYMYNARMSGDEAGVGLVLTEGRVAEVREERLHPAERGDLIAFLPPTVLAPDDKICWAWTVFAYADRAEYWQVVRRYAPKITISPRLPEVGEKVLVTVDDEVPPTVTVDGAVVDNPFRAPYGAFVLQPIADRPETTIACSGVPHVVRWSEAYRGWSRAKGANPRRHIAESVAYAEQFAATGDTAMYDNAVRALALYYRTLGAYRRPQAFLPRVLIKSNDALRQQFAAHVEGVLRPNRRRYTAQTALAEYDMMRVANYVFEGKYAVEEEATRMRAMPLLDTPFGPLFGEGKEAGAGSSADLSAATGDGADNA